MCIEYLAPSASKKVNKLHVAECWCPCSQSLSDGILNPMGKKTNGMKNKRWRKRKQKEETQKQWQWGRNFAACVPHPWKLSTRQPVGKRCCGQLLRRRTAVKLNSQAPSSHVAKNQSLPQNRGQRRTHAASILCSHYRKGISTIWGLNVCLFDAWTPWGIWLFVTHKT